MPLKLQEPRNDKAGKPKTPFYSVRGTHMGVYVDRSTGLRDEKKAARLLVQWRGEIERGEFARAEDPTFASAALAYMQAGGERRFMTPLLKHFGEEPLTKIGQKAIDTAASTLYPNEAPSTRNRQVYTVVSAILKHAGVQMPLRRPKGAQGRQRVSWLTKEQAFALFAAADARDREFGIFVRLLTYTGMRLGEGLGLTVESVDLDSAFAYVPITKTGEPRGVHLPPVIVRELRQHPRGLDRPGKRVFRFTKCGRLYTWLDEAFGTAGITAPDRTAFHILRHTWGTWMRRYGGLDTRGLVGTQAWADEASASRYSHVVASEEAKRADLLPVEPIRGETVENGKAGGDENLPDDEK